MSTGRGTKRNVTFSEASANKPFTRLATKPMWNEMCTGVYVKRDPENIGWVESENKPTEKDQEEWIINVIQPAINKTKWTNYELCVFCYQIETEDRENNLIEFSFENYSVECCKCNRSTQIPKWYYNYIFRHQLYVNSFMISRGYNHIVDGCDIIWYKDSDVNITVSLGRNLTK